MLIEPLDDYVVLEEVKNELKGIILPENVDISPTKKAMVIGAGPTSKLSLGQLVLYKSYGFEEIEVDLKKYLVGKSENVFAVLHQADA